MELCFYVNWWNQKVCSDEQYFTKLNAFSKSKNHEQLQTVAIKIKRREEEPRI